LIHRSFELSEILLEELESRSTLDLGDITYFEISSPGLQGSIENITVNVYDNNNVLINNYNDDEDDEDMKIINIQT
jgi:hypothetical protein